MVQRRIVRHIAQPKLNGVPGRNEAPMVKTHMTSDPERTDPFTIALQGLSLEIGVHDLEALDRNRHLLPTRGRIYVNAVAGEGAEARIRTAAQLTALGCQPVPHIAARRMRTVQELDDYLGSFVERGAGIREILVIGGDLTEPWGPYANALDVMNSGGPVGHNNPIWARCEITSQDCTCLASTRSRRHRVGAQDF